MHHPYYLANCLANLFPGPPQRQKHQVFFAVPTKVDTAMKSLLLLMRYAFN